MSITTSHSKCLQNLEILLERYDEGVKIWVLLVGASTWGQTFHEFNVGFIMETGIQFAKVDGPKLMPGDFQERAGFDGGEKIRGWTYRQVKRRLTQTPERLERPRLARYSGCWYEP